MTNIKKVALILAGSAAIFLGVLGIFLPLLPTTPFLLLGAACYVRGSETLYDWLIHHKWLGNYIKNYREGNGIPKKTKILAISTLWGTIGYSVLFVLSMLWLKILLVLIASGVTLHLLSLPTLNVDK